MAIEKYVGQYVTAEDANEYIDGYTILNSCNLLQDAARKLSDIATACALGNSPSKSVLAITGSNELASNTIRISISHLTTMDDIELFLKEFINLVKE